MMCAVRIHPSIAGTTCRSQTILCRIYLLIIEFQGAYPPYQAALIVFPRNVCLRLRITNSLYSPKSVNCRRTTGDKVR